jgi:tetratricopeptide (TPR) repeat protein
VVEGIRKVTEELRAMKRSFAPEISLLDEKRGFELLTLGSHTGSDSFYWEAIETFQRAIHTNPYNMNAWSGIAEAWFFLQRYQDALLVCERVLQVPTFSESYWAILSLKADALEKVGKYDEATNIKTSMKKMKTMD